VDGMLPAAVIYAVDICNEGQFVFFLTSARRRRSFFLVEKNFITTFAAQCRT
jgi:hypothetical protein